jgi:hypothetical protein
MKFSVLTASLALIIAALTEALFRLSDAHVCSEVYLVYVAITINVCWPDVDFEDVELNCTCAKRGLPSGSWRRARSGSIASEERGPNVRGILLSNNRDEARRKW